MQLAIEFINHTADHIFLTGKAGTGKTTFLRNLRGFTSKRMVVVAPTGVAALNASGVTIHSLFQLPFGAITSASLSASNMRFSKDKIEILQSMDLLVIDEISMVRSDIMDAIDIVMRRFRDPARSFGGVQLLMIGDLQQLAPVITHSDLETLKNTYSSFYFFDSYALKSSSFHTIELKTIYRQQDRQFIELLDAVRNGELTEKAQGQLNARYIPNFRAPINQNYITLTSHLDKAQVINSAKMAEIQKETISFEAKIWGDFPEHLYPNDTTLKLKLGAQVMFTRNDTGKEKLFYNGKIGIINEINARSIKVSFSDEAGGGFSQTISVPQVEWKNIRYQLNDENGKIEEVTIGTFVQYPLRAAWAITIHKSQGLTFNHAIIDAQSSFSHGQVYVALSRCTSLEGLVLTSPITSTSIIRDTLINDFNSNNSEPTSDDLTESRNLYFEFLLHDIFDFHALESLFSNVVYYYTSQLGKGISQSADYPVPYTLTQVSEQVHEQITEVGDKIGQHLHAILHDCTDDNHKLIAFLNRAAGYYQQRLGEIIVPVVHNLRCVKANTKPITKAMNSKLTTLEKNLDIKISLINYLNQCTDFDIDTYHDIKSSPTAGSSGATTTSLSKKDKGAAKGKDNSKLEAPQYIASENRSMQGPAHPDLYRTLIAWRRDVAVRENTLPFKVATIHEILALSQKPCLKIEEISLIESISADFVERYGKQIVDIGIEYLKVTNELDNHDKNLN